VLAIRGSYLGKKSWFEKEISKQSAHELKYK
jgi:hypothetical protein